MRYLYHNAGVAVGTGGADKINQTHQGERAGETAEIPGQDIVIDQGFEEVGPADRAKGACDQKNRHENERGLVRREIT